MGMLDSLQRLGRSGLQTLSTLGRAGIFLVNGLFVVPSWRGFPLFVRQLFSVGVLSLSVSVVSSLFFGVVLGLQGYNFLVDYGSESAIGTMVALALVRELGPVVTALLFAGRAGSAPTPEIGLM